MVATKPGLGGIWEICRVYAEPALHGSGVGAHLMDQAEAHASNAGAAGFELWTDTRFARAHRFYEKRGYQRGTRRALHDRCHSEEWHYTRHAVPGAVQT